MITLLSLGRIVATPHWGYIIYNAGITGCSIEASFLAGAISCAMMSELFYFFFFAVVVYFYFLYYVPSSCIHDGALLARARERRVWRRRHLVITRRLTSCLRDCYALFLYKLHDLSLFFLKIQSYYFACFW